MKHPLDPYGFSVVWYQTSMPMHEVTLNPPLAAYYAALAGAWAGWSEFHLHLAFLLPAVIVVLGVYQLARGLCDSPVLAAVSARGARLSRFLDQPDERCSHVGALDGCHRLWREGLETENPIRLGASAVIMAACALTKYFGACLIPLLLLYSIWKQRRLGLWASISGSRWCSRRLPDLDASPLWTRLAFRRGGMGPSGARSSSSVSSGDLSGRTELRGRLCAFPLWRLFPGFGSKSDSCRPGFIVCERRRHCFGMDTYGRPFPTRSTVVSGRSTRAVHGRRSRCPRTGLV